MPEDCNSERVSAEKCTTLQQERMNEWFDNEVKLSRHILRAKPVLVLSMLKMLMDFHTFDYLVWVNHANFGRTNSI